MNPILHIALKDLTGLRWQALLVLTLQLSYAALLFRPRGVAGAGFAEIVLGWLIVATHFYFISCAVHADAIPGDRQYWLTRPFTRTQLLAAKCLVAVCVVHVPLLLSDCLILTGHQFNPLAYSGGLLWRQLLYLLAGTLPILALSAVTRNLTQFALAAIVLIALLFILPSVLPWFSMNWGGLQWMKAVLNILLAATGASAVLYLLYLRRKLPTAWAVLGATAAIIPFSSDFTPFAAAFDVQRRLHPRPPFQASIQFDPERLSTFPSDRRVDADRLTLTVPIRLENVPFNAALHADSISATLRLPDGQSHPLRRRGSWSADLATRAQWVFFPLERTLYEQFRDTNVTVDIRFYLTSFGTSRTYQMPAKSADPRPMGELGRCSSSPDLANIIVVSCFAPVHLPPRITAQMVDPKTGRPATRDTRLSEGFNYSPIPADRFQLSPIVQANSHFSIMSLPGQSKKSYSELLESNVQFSVRDPRSHFTAALTVPSTPLRNLIR